MLVKKVIEHKTQEIDLTGPDGNAFILLGRAKRWGNQIDPTMTENLLQRMESGDYINLVAVFEITFGAVCELKMDDGLLKEVSKKVEEIKETNSINWDMDRLGF